MVIENCKVTHQDSEVLRECSMEQSDTQEFHTGIDLVGATAYSIYDGVVVAVGHYSSNTSVIIRSSSSLCMKYDRVLDCSVSAGERVSAGQPLGTIDRYVHVEALSNTPSSWPVRIGRSTWYKCDVTSCIYGTLTISDEMLFSSLGIHEISGASQGEIDVLQVPSESVLHMLSNNRGD